MQQDQRVPQRPPRGALGRSGAPDNDRSTSELFRLVQPDGVGDGALGRPTVVRQHGPSDRVDQDAVGFRCRRRRSRVGEQTVGHVREHRPIVLRGRQPTRRLARRRENDLKNGGRVNG